MARDNAPVASIDLRALAANYRILHDVARPARVAAAVKANAYGLGLQPVVETLASEGCDTFFTAHFDEGLALRAILPRTTVAVLHGLAASEIDEAIARDVLPVINDLGLLESWQRRARDAGRPLPAIVHVDTGMNRLGLSVREQQTLVREPERLDGIELVAWMSHLACADHADHPKNAEQLDAFTSLLRVLPAAPASLANSSGIFLGGAYHLDLVRPGAALFGVNPTPGSVNPMHAVVTLRAPILRVHEVSAPMTVGYGGEFTASGPTRVASLALGYADGWLRALGNKGNARLGEHAVPLVGRVSMDLVTVDVSSVPESLAYPGAMVELIGPHRTIDQVAADAGTIGYEILTALGERVARVYDAG